MHKQAEVVDAMLAGVADDVGTVREQLKQGVLYPTPDLTFHALLVLLIAKAHDAIEELVDVLGQEAEREAPTFEGHYQPRYDC